MTCLVMVRSPAGVHVFVKRIGPQLASAEQDPPADPLLASPELGPPPVIVAGGPDDNHLHRLLCEHSDVVYVPEPWLRGIPPQRPRQRAARAARLAAAYLEYPIELRLAREKKRWPF